MSTAYHSQYWAHALTLRGSGGDIAALSRSIANARVDLKAAAEGRTEGVRPVTAQVIAQVAECCREQPQPARIIMGSLGLKHWKTFQANYLQPLIEAGVLERTIPDKPTSRLQKYRLTDKGRAALKGQGGGAS